MKFILKMLRKYKSLISYGFWGVCTTIVNIAVYSLCYDFLSIANVPSTVIAWFFSVVIAYITNKLFVFDSKSFRLDVLIKEVISFFSCRLLTGIMDVIIMYVAVDICSLNSMLWKIISNILVIILNYIAGRLIVFKKRNDDL